MNSQIKKCLKELNRQKYLNLSTLGNVITPILFKKDKVCLKLVDNLIYIFYPLAELI